MDGFVNREGDPLPLMVQKSDGGYNYASTDMAAIRHRVEEEHAERIIYVTDAGQAQHFQMIFQAAKEASLRDLACHRSLYDKTWATRKETSSTTDADPMKMRSQQKFCCDEG